MVHEIGSVVAESARALPAAVGAYPSAQEIHIVRDGRDVVYSLLERGWLSASGNGRDDTRQAYASHARLWVEPELVERFEHESDARRAIDEEAGPLPRELGYEP